MTYEPLTERQNQVLRRAAEGWAASEIAVELGITEDCVRSHYGLLYKKMGARNKAHAVHLWWLESAGSLGDECCG